MQRTVTSRLVFEITEPAVLVFSIAAAGVYSPSGEQLSARLSGEPVRVTELSDAHATRLHEVRCGVGELVVTYSATVEGTGAPAPSDDIDRLTYLRPSRYAESDRLAAVAAAEFAGIGDATDLLTAVSSWVGTHLGYVSGSSLPTDGAVSTLLSRQGVCRDFAHLCIALLRARGVPARFVSVYAPGLSPMDFHAVVEAWVDGAWRVVDATALAPRSALVRIATGRDAADAAFVNALSGRADFVSSGVTAVADVLPNDDLDDLVSLR